MIIKHAERDRLTRNAVVLDLGDLRRTAEAMEAAAKSHAQSIIEAAKAEREKILAGVQEQGFAEGRAAGTEQGMTEGRARGHAEAMAAARAEASKAVEAWSAALDEFEGRRGELLLDAQSEVLALAIAIAERITRRKIQIDPAIVADQLAAALALTVAPSRLAIRTHPDDLELAKTVLPTLLQRLTSSPNITLDADPALSRGSIALRTDSGEVDASIETQLDRIVEALLPSGAAPLHGAGVTEQEHTKETPRGESLKG